MSEPNPNNPFHVNFLEQQQVRYEQKLVRQLLETCAGPGHAGTVGPLLRSAEPQADFAWFNETFADCLVAVGSVKLRAPVPLHTLVGGSLNKEPWYVGWLTHADNHSDRSYRALVFDYTGDKVSDLVAHNVEFLTHEPSRFRVTISLDGDKDIIFIETWKGFLQNLSVRYRPFS